MGQSPTNNQVQLFRLAFAINASVGAGFRVGELEYVGELLLRARDTAGVLALNDINYLLGHFGVVFCHSLAVLDDVYCDIGIDISKDLEVGEILRIDLDYILASHSFARRVFDNGDRAIKLVKSEEIVDLHTLTRFYVVDNDSVLYRIYMHNRTSLIYSPLLQAGT